MDSDHVTCLGEGNALGPHSEDSYAHPETTSKDDDDEKGWSNLDLYGVLPGVSEGLWTSPSHLRILGHCSESGTTGKKIVGSAFTV